MKKNYIDNSIIEQMVSDGYTEKMIHHYFKYIEREKSEDFSNGYMEWAHSKGFVANRAIALGIDETNYQDFISDYDFYRSWPHNSWLRLWVNDKLTLKYMLHGTQYQSNMPEYYYYAMPNDLRALVDNPYNDQTDETFLKLLKEKKSFACKPNNGTESAGFHKLSFTDGKFELDSEEISESNLLNFVRTHTNYVYTEYLEPGKGLERMGDKIHTLRITVVNEHGNDPLIVGGYLRFYVSSMGEANCIQKFGNLSDFKYLAEVDMKTGRFGNGKAVYANRVENMPCHPDSNCLVEGTIENWEEVLTVVYGVSRYLFGTEFIGFDIGITNEGVKIMEINTLPGNMGNQWSRNVTDNEPFKRYIRSKLKAIDNLPESERRKRRTII